MGLIKDATNNALTYKLIGIAMDIHNKLGPGLKEQVYQGAFEEELRSKRIAFEPQKEVEIYAGMSRIGLLFADLFVNNSVVVELKSLSHLTTKNEIAQVIAYLKVLGCQTGLIFNFGRKHLEYKRIFPPKKVAEFSDPDLRHGVRANNEYENESTNKGAINEYKNEATNGTAVNECKNESANGKGGQRIKNESSNRKVKYEIVIR